MQPIEVQRPSFVMLWASLACIVAGVAASVVPGLIPDRNAVFEVSDEWVRRDVPLSKRWHFIPINGEIEMAVSDGRIVTTDTAGQMSLCAPPGDSRDGAVIVRDGTVEVCRPVTGEDVGYSPYVHIRAKRRGATVKVRPMFEH